jgi:hypothetical protein
MELVRFRGRRAAGRVGLLLAAQLAGICADFTGVISDFTNVVGLARAAEPAPIAAWSAPAECPNAESIVQRLLVLGGGSVRRFSVAGSVRGEVVKEGEEWVLTLQIIPAGAAGSDDAVGPARVLRARDCDDLAEAGAVAVAIALGGIVEERSEGETFVPRVYTSARNAPRFRIVTGSIGPARTIAAPASIAPPSVSSALSAAAENPPPASESPAAAKAPTPDDETPENDVPPEPEEPSSFAFLPSAGLVLDAASLGGAAWGPSAQTELRWGSFGAGVYGFWLPRQQISVATAQSVELSLLSAGVRGCYRAGNAGPFVDVCAGGEFGSLSAAGRGLLDASSRRDPWGAATGGVLLGIDLLRALEAGARLEAVLPLWRERYLVNQNDLVHEVPRASLRLGLSLAGAFGNR